jgi:hypothetical protein
MLMHSYTRHLKNFAAAQNAARFPSDVELAVNAPHPVSLALILAVFVTMPRVTMTLTGGFAVMP